LPYVVEPAKYLRELDARLLGQLVHDRNREEQSFLLKKTPKNVSPLQALF